MLKKLSAPFYLAALFALCFTPAIPADLSEVEVKQAAADLLQAERLSPTTAVNVEERFMRLSRIIIAWHRDRMPVNEILPQKKGEKIRFLIHQGQKKEAAAMVSTAIPLLARFLHAEQITSVSSRQAFEQDSIRDYTYDADNFLWGTQIYPMQIDNTLGIINKFLQTKFLKINIQQQMVSREGKFTETACLPSQNDCRVRYNLDEVAHLFKFNNWSMIPMLSFSNVDNVNSASIDRYVEFVDWFINRYKDNANIRYVELTNAPVFDWKGTSEQLLRLNNIVYDHIKSRHPSIMVGSPGFEYMIDTPPDHKSVQEIEYFLRRENNAKFDYWAFHGYPLTGNKFSGIYPPTKTAVNNKYAGVQGILEIRKKMDENGWQGRQIIDTEHVGTTLPKPMITYEDDSLDAAYMLQELILKRTLCYKNKIVLAGIIPLKISPRGDKGEFAWASLNADGSLTRTVEAVRLLWSKLKEYRYDSHVNGEYDNEKQVWVEKFSNDEKELYVFFKPFKYRQGQTIKLDNETLQYDLKLKRNPASITLTEIDGVSSIPPESIVALRAVNTPKFLEIAYSHERF